MVEGVKWWRCAYALASLLSVQGIKEGPNSALILLQDPCGESHDHVISARDGWSRGTCGWSRGLGTMCNTCS